MKIAPKKVYCSNCKKLVKGKEQKTDSTVRIICPKCNKPVWVREGFSWRYIKEPD
jgi:Zn finger protein HypA/HybF involved in hydrogenase expression